MQLCACGVRADDDATICAHCGAPLSPASENQEFAAGALFGSYRLIRQIGSGGMGRVFIAEHVRLGRQVALKILRTEYSGNLEAVHRFFAEARAVNTINHENIIEVSDFIENENGPSFYVMELLKGVDLRTLQQREGKLPIARAINIAIQVCRGLGAAHDAGIVHRDLKPDNIFLVERDGRRDFVKLLDFGVAKLMNAKLDDAPSYTTSAGIAVGTPEYMSPEQALGQTVDHLADVYATGIIIFEMISGQRPFHANSAREIMVKHMTATPPRVSKATTYPYSIPPLLDQLIAHCLKKEPQDRPLNIKEVEDRLQKIALRLQQDFVTPATSLVPLQREKRVWWAVGAAVVLAAATMALALRPRPSAIATPTTGSLADVPAQTQVRLTFDSDPPGATVYRERATQSVGITPFTATLQQSSRPETFEFEMEGRQTVRQTLVLSEDMVVRVTLPPSTPEAAAPGSRTPGEPAPRRRGNRRGEPAGEGKNQSSALDRGAVLNPFE